MTSLAAKAVTKVLKGRVAQQAPSDPHYETVIDSRGKEKKHVRAVPPGLSKRDQRALKKIRKRAHYLDKGMNLCGFRVGWTFFIGIVPGLGDVADASLNYFLIVRPSKKLDIPESLLAKMLANNAISIGLGLVPIAGDIALAAWKANSRNAHLLEAYLVIRGEEFLASQRQGASPITQADAVAHGVSPDALRDQFGPGSGMTDHEEHHAAVAEARAAGGGGGGWFGKKKVNQGTTGDYGATAQTQQMPAHVGTGPVQR
ncbi:hypothetical protein CI109_105267 [Kwoniella shandongensis]|uniref:Uncharacterized protein n=1 Tax=Kwoniella shandongensis TaxID=1734106 RepID=A0A5M6C3P5_9TREE|nr:uncharacterized protein CI109_002110 [Kwoniella shandongensis]KAA5529684.1 hypothetical protein CI109_002110 [Kwoniella shandongensis]